MTKLLILSVAFMLSIFSAKADNDVSVERNSQNTPGGWQAVELPELPTITSANTYNITTYGASTSSHDNTSAIQAALNAVPTTGGMVVIPEGTWLCGPIVVKSKTIVHISKNATLKLLPFGGTTEANKTNCYPSNGKNSSGLFNYDVFMSNGNTSINDVIVEGEGTTSVIDGQGKVWWDNYKSLGTRPSLIRFKKGTRFLFRNFKLLNSPGTNLTLGGSGNASHFTVHDVTISAPSSEASSPSHNTDGIPIWGPYANIYNCDISTGDDNVVVDSDGHHIHAWNIKCGYGHGMSIGSYTSRVHDVIYEDITFNNTGSGFRIKSAAGRSGNNSVGSNGAVSNIICRNATMTGVAGPIKITSWYDSDDSNPANVSTPSTVTETTPEFCDILFQNITANAVSGATSWKHACPVYIYGRPEMYIHDIILDNVKINSKVGMFLAYCKDIIFKNGCKVVNEASSSKTINVQYQNTILGKYDGTSSQYDGTKNPSYGVIEDNKAEDTFWTFENGYAAEYTSNASVNGLNIAAASGKIISVNASNKTYNVGDDNLTFTSRLQFGGSGSTTSRNVNFNVTGPCTIEVWAVSGNSDYTRDLMVSDGTNQATILTTGSELKKGTYQYNGSGGNIYLYSANSGINLYGIRVKYEGSVSSDPVTLIFTAAVQGGSNAAGTSLNQETHYYNNWGTSSWAAQAYIGFSVTLPACKQIKSATLKFTSYCGGNYDGRKVDVYCLSAQDAASFNSSNPVLSKAIGTLVASETDNRTQTLKTIDATSAVKAVTMSGTTSTVIFQLGGAAAGAQLYGKASSLAPTLELELEDYISIMGDVNKDGNVNIIDLVKLISYLNNSSQIPIDTIAADTDKDGNITKNDVIMLGNMCIGK